MPNGEVNITITDGALAVVSAPPSSVQAVIGCADAGTDLQIVQTRSKTTLSSSFTGGPLMQAAGLTVDGGGTVLAVKVPTNTAGTAGTVDSSGKTGTSAVTVTGAPNDDYQVVLDVALGGTIGAGPIKFTLSIDGGRTFGPAISLGTANSYAIAGTGMTLHFGAGTLVTDDVVKFETTGPRWLLADVQAALDVLAASPLTWGGGIHLVGPITGTQATSLEAALETLATDDDRFTFLLASARDDDRATSESEAAWMTSIEADFASVDARRVVVGAGMVNVQSPYKTAVCGAPMYRRPITWPAAQRTVAVPIHVHLGRVKDGALLGTTGPGTASLAIDGYIYHDERVNPGLDAARFMAARTIVNRPGVYIKNPNLMAPPGSDFTILPYRRVMDAACAITHDTLEEFVDDNVRLNADGTILEKDAQHIEAILTRALRNGLVSPGSASSVSAVVDRTVDINTAKILKVTVRVFALGYLLEVDIDIGYQSSAEAA